MVAENSGIKDKGKLLKYLYNNPNKLAHKLSQFLKNEEGELLPMVKLKGKGKGFYYSIQEKRFLLVARDEEFYLLPWEHKENKEKCYVYSHYNWMTGRIFSVYRDDIELIGLN